MDSHFGEWLKDQRRSVGINRQSDLAQRAGVSQQTVSSWETGETVPEPERLAALAAALEVSVEEITARAYAMAATNMTELARFMRRADVRFDRLVAVLEKMTERFDEFERRLANRSGNPSDRQDVRDANPTHPMRRFQPRL